MGYIRSFKVYEKVPVSQCITVKGKQPIGVVWAVTNKGDEEHPDIRARLCAQEVQKRDPGREDVFAATPPLEGLKLLVSLGMIEEQKLNKTDPDCFMILDVERAHFHSPATRDNVFVRLCAEDGVEGWCARPLKSMYGTRDAAVN